jgi:hypothetical protein
MVLMCSSVDWISLRKKSMNIEKYVIATSKTEMQREKKRTE